MEFKEIDLGQYAAINIPKGDEEEEKEKEEDLKSVDLKSLLTDNKPVNECYISDTIHVEIIPEKRGMFLKHTEYQIKSENYKCSVEHRYNDFLYLYENLLKTYEFRLIPRLPPKLLINSYLEDRRSGLQRWLTLLSQHPILSRDDLLKMFYAKSNINFQDLPELEDEFELLSSSIQLNKYNNLEEILLKREQMKKILRQLLEIKRLINLQIKSKINQRSDYGEMANILRAFMLSTKDKSMNDFAQNFHEISKVDEINDNNNNLQNNVLERLEMIIEIVTAFNDLCDRIIHLKDISPYDKSYKGFNGLRLKNMIRTNLTNVTLEDEIERAELQKRRISFGIYCISEEFLIMQKYLKLLPSVILQFTFEESKTYAAISQILQAVIGIESDKLN